MKKLTLTVASVLLLGAALAQDYTPPAKAITALSTKYANATVQEWYEGFEGAECSFENNGLYGIAFFSQSGNWMYSEYTLEESELPEAVAEMLAEDFEGYEIFDITMTESSKMTTYAISIFNEATEDNRIVTYDETGDLIDEMVITTEDDSSE